jgi:hypothetical protein
MLIVANMIFPAFLTPYVSMLIMPFLGLWLLFAEWKTLAWLEKHHIPPRKGILFLYIVLANILSSLIGCGVSLLFPTGLTTQTIERATGETIKRVQFDSAWGAYAVLSFILLYCISIPIEGVVLRLRLRQMTLTHPWRDSWYINTVSYGGLGLLWLLTR